jgi:hypothetical protein
MESSNCGLFVEVFICFQVVIAKNICMPGLIASNASRQMNILSRNTIGIAMLACVMGVDSKKDANGKK